MEHLEDDIQKSYTKIIIIILGLAIISSALLLIFYNFYQIYSKMAEKELLTMSSNINLIIQPGYEIEINKKPVVVFGSDDCESKDVSPLFTLQENPTGQCIKITKDTLNVMAYLILNRQIIIEQWKVVRTITPEGNVVISLKRPNGEAVIPFNRIEKLINERI